MTKGTLPNPGTYQAARNSMMVIEAKETGSLLCWIPYRLTNSEVNYSGKHCLTIGQKDGTLSERNINTLKKIFPDWDGQDLFALEEIPLPEDQNQPEFELADCYHDNSYTPAGASEPVIQLKAQWLNPLGGTQNMPARMDEADRKKVLTAWGGKLRAASGAKSAAKATASSQKAQPAAPAKPSAPARPAAGGPPSRKGSPPAGGQARTATQEEVWDALVASKGEGADTDEMSAEYWAAADKVAPGSNGELNPAQWGKVMTELGL